MTDTVRRDYLIDQAVRAGKFPSSRAAHYAAQYDRDPAGTEQLLASLASVGSGVLGHAGAAMPVQAEHVHPVVRAPESIELTPANVEQWTHDLFPETRAGGVAKQGRITRDAT